MGTKKADGLFDVQVSSLFCLLPLPGNTVIGRQFVSDGQLNQATPCEMR